MAAVGNKIPDASSLANKTDYDAKILDTEKNVTDHDIGEYTTTSKFNKLKIEVFKARLAQVYLVTKTDFDVR